MATREGWRYQHVQAIIVAMDQYAEVADRQPRVLPEQANSTRRAKLRVTSHDPQLRLVEFGPNGVWRKSRRGRLSRSATRSQSRPKPNGHAPDPRVTRMDGTHLVTAGPRPVPLLVQQPSGRSCRARNHRSAIPPRGDSHWRCRSQAHRRSELRGPHSFRSMRCPSKPSGRCSHAANRACDRSLH